MSVPVGRKLLSGSTGLYRKTFQMRVVSFVNPIRFKGPSSVILSPSTFYLHLRPPSRENGSFADCFNRKCRYFPATISFFRANASLSSDSPSYGGWDEIELAVDTPKLGESSQLRHFLVSVGIDDKSHVFIFLLGLICALAISRVRVSKIIVFPAAVLVFSVGFSFGFVRGGSFSDGSSSERKKKEELVRVYSDRLKTLVGFFDDFDVKFCLLKNNIKRAIESNKITADELENYKNVVDSVRLSASNARDILVVSGDGTGNSNRETQKSSSRRRKDTVEGGPELLQFIDSLFGKKIVGSKATQANDATKRESLETELHNQTQFDSSRPAVEDRNYAPVNKSEGNADPGLSQDTLDSYGLNLEDYRKLDMDLESRKVEWAVNTVGRSAKRYANRNDHSSRNNLLQPMYKDLNNGRENMRLESERNMGDPLDLHMESESSFTHEQIFRKSSVSCRSFHNWAKSQREPCGERIDFDDDSSLAGGSSASETEVGSSSSSKFVEDVVFDKYLTEANALLKDAKGCVKGRCDEEHAEIILDRSALLLSKAVAMKPMSLLAVGQLGNTYLLHGELKLYSSRELRSLLSSNNLIGLEGQGKVFRGLDNNSLCKDELASVLVNVCEECEELLVNAGRKYRRALSIDGNDVRSLYNWGLALSFRAQLIADIGPEAAFDADKLFLAAIDKFDAMMSKSNGHAPDALFRWAVTLQQRSRLRPHHSKEKVKLLHQAKRLYEDALHMDLENVQVRDALSSCISELNYKYFQPS